MEKSISQKYPMPEVKFLWTIIDIVIGIPLTYLGITINLDNPLGAVISVGAAIYVYVRIYFYILQKKQAVREKELELWHKIMDQKERQLKFDKATEKVNGH